MNCNFCHKKYEISKTSKPFNIIYECNNHMNKITHYIHDGHEWNYSVTNWHYNNSDYNITIYYEKDEGGPRFLVEGNTSPVDKVLELLFIPDITPEQYDEKLPLWIAIS